MGLPGPVDDALRHVEEETDAEERLRWAEVFESVGQFSTAHDILLKTTVPAGLRHQHRMLTAQILTEQCVVAGFSTARDIADALYGECDSCPEALRPAVYEAWATCRLKTGNPSGAENVIRKISPVRGRAASILAHALAAQNRWTEARGYSGANPREFDLERQSTETYEDYQRRWSSHVHKLLSESTVITAIHQAAQHALDRGHFATAKLLLDRGFAQDPDNLYLNLTSAKLLHEQGGYAKAIKHYEAILNQIAGRENTLVKYACLDTEIEGCRRGIRKSIEQPVPRPLSRRNEEPIFLTRPFECRALGLQAKYVWHGPKEMSHRLEWSGHSSLADLVSAILQTDPDPPLQSQMARMLASPEVNDAQQARRVAKAAVKAADDNQALLSRIICRNTLARILPSSEAEAVLKESLDLDPANTYTLFLMSEVLDWTGRAEQAEEYSSRANRFRDQPLVRQQAESN